jgi:glycosyltransferase involved in cell wall biosynthesis
MLLKFLRLLLSNVSLTRRLLHPRRIANAVRFLFSDNGNLLQLYRRYQDIYRPWDPAEQARIIEAVRSRPSVGTVFIFPIIDWNFRFQRPQHIASQLGALGFRVFYFSTTPSRHREHARYEFTATPAGNVYLCSLFADSGPADLHRTRMSQKTRDDYARSIEALTRDLELDAPAIIVQHYYWAPLAQQLPRRTLGYDCMDHHVAFFAPDDASLPEQEEQLIRQCDFVVTSSAYLQKKIGRIRDNTLIRNGCDHALFARVPVRQPDSARPVAGYVGAIAEWFDIELLAEVAKLLPRWRFVLVGARVGCDMEAARDRVNIEFVGEVDYASVPDHLASFDVCMIPFRLTELTKATNPLKVYEYLSAGKPVVSTPLPEVEMLGERVLIGATAAAFAARLEQSLIRAGEPDFADSAKTWAQAHDWRLRAGRFAELLAPARTAPS